MSIHFLNRRADVYGALGVHDASFLSESSRLPGNPRVSNAAGASPGAGEQGYADGAATQEVRKPRNW